MNVFKGLISVSIFVLLGMSVNGQNHIIRVVDAKTNEPLIGVNASMGDGGSITDANGELIVNLEKWPIRIALSYVGYDNVSLTLNDRNNLPFFIEMRPSTTILDLVTVTGAKYEQNLQQATVSVDIIKPDLLRSVNATNSDQILNKVPGVQVLDGQPNIRGGAGYSYGAGSRVMLLIDDIPALQPDAGFPNWSDIPIENLAQIEILKGAASTLYGSAALNGIINFRSSYATSEPETRIAAGLMVYDKPQNPNDRWWGDTLRYESNVSIVHKQKFNKLDVIASGFYTKLEGFNQFTNHERGRANLNLRYRLKDNLVFRINGLYNGGVSNSFFIWGGNSVQAPDTFGLRQAFPGTVSERSSRRIYLDPSVTYNDNWGGKHKIMARTIWVDNVNDTEQSNNSVNNYTEYQWMRNIDKYDLHVTSGLVASWNKTNSQILGDTTFYGQNHAAYIQLDKKIGDYLTLNGGLRYEYVQQNSPEIFGTVTIPNGIAKDDAFIGRLALNYHPTDFTSFRASFGQGYRYPTLTERFVTTSFSIFSIFANPTLLPEKGWTMEFGVKQGFKARGFQGFIDAAIFRSDYQDMIEFTFLGLPNIGFVPLNVGNTTISGYEIGITGQLYAGKVPITVFGGYTYINPTYKNFETSDILRESVSSSDTSNVLKYRSRHQFKMDAEAKIWKFRWGASVQYASHFVNIDRAFERPLGFLGPQAGEIDLFGIRTFRENNNKGFILLDTRLAFDFEKLTISLLCNNILNTDYTLRPALLEAPRTFGMRLDVKL